jgi:hypothetical protein
VIRHHQVGLLAHADPPLDGDTTGLQAFVFLTEAERVDHHTVAQQTPLFWVEDPRWNLVQNEFIVPDMYGMTGVGPTLVTGDHMYVLGEDIDNLSLPFVAPLATYHHRTVPGVSTLRHVVIPHWEAQEAFGYQRKKPIPGGMGSGQYILVGEASDPPR